MTRCLISLFVAVIILAVTSARPPIALGGVEPASIAYRGSGIAGAILRAKETS